jgi:hypothetical protein
MVEDEFAFELIELQVLAVELGCDVGLPVFGNLGEFFGDVDFVHGLSSGFGDSLMIQGNRKGRKEKPPRMPRQRGGRRLRSLHFTDNSYAVNAWFIVEQHSC